MVHYSCCRRIGLGRGHRDGDDRRAWSGHRLGCRGRPPAHHASNVVRRSGIPAKVGASDRSAGRAQSERRLASRAERGEGGGLPRSGPTQRLWLLREGDQQAPATTGTAGDWLPTPGQKKPRRSGAKFGRSIVMGLPCEAANPPTQRGRRIIGCTPRLRTRVASVAAPLR